MKKRLALAAALAFSIIPFTSFADHLEPDESEIKKGRELVSTKLEDYDLFSNNLSDDILIAFTVNGYEIEPCADLSGADLSNAYLKNADLSGCNLTNADLSGDRMGQANLEGANLKNAVLNGADLSRADLSDATLNGADLKGANLSGAFLQGADVSGADLSRANLNGTYLLSLIHISEPTRP